MFRPFEKFTDRGVVMKILIALPVLSAVLLAHGVAPSRPTIPHLVKVGPSELRRAHHFQRFMRMILVEVGGPLIEFA